MDAFNYRDGELFAEGVALSAIAERFGTPTYVYSRAHIEAQYRPTPMHWRACRTWSASRSRPTPTWVY
jgi:diaminopimelate decarboxylase